MLPLLANKDECIMMGFIIRGPHVWGGGKVTPNGLDPLLQNFWIRLFDPHNKILDIYAYIIIYGFYRTL